MPPLQGSEKAPEERNIPRRTSFKKGTSEERHTILLSSGGAAHHLQHMKNFHSGFSQRMLQSSGGATYL